MSPFREFFHAFPSKNKDYWINNYKCTMLTSSEKFSFFFYPTWISKVSNWLYLHHQMSPTPQLHSSKIWNNYVYINVTSVTLVLHFYLFLRYSLVVSVKKVILKYNLTLSYPPATLSTWSPTSSSSNTYLP